MKNYKDYKDCRPYSWWVRLIDKWFGIRMTCDYRCQMGNPGAPCQFPNTDVVIPLSSGSTDTTATIVVSGGVVTTVTLTSKKDCSGSHHATQEKK